MQLLTDWELHALCRPDWSWTHESSLPAFTYWLLKGMYLTLPGSEVLSIEFNLNPWGQDPHLIIRILAFSFPTYFLFSEKILLTFWIKFICQSGRSDHTSSGTSTWLPICWFFLAPMLSVLWFWNLTYPAPHRRPGHRSQCSGHIWCPGQCALESQYCSIIWVVVFP